MGDKSSENKSLTDALAYLARLARQDPKNPIVASRLQSVLASLSGALFDICGMILLAFALTTAVSLAADRRVSAAQPNVSRGIEFLERGEFGKAVPIFRAAVEFYDRSRQTNQEVMALHHLSITLQWLGHHKLALTNLMTALPLARQIGDRSQLIAVQCSLATVQTLLGRPEGRLSFYLTNAEGLLSSSLQLAKELNDATATAAVRNNYGNWYAAQGRHVDALEQYRKAAKDCAAPEAALVLVQSLANGARSAAINGATELAQALNREALQHVSRLTSRFEKAQLLTLIGRNFFLMASAQPGLRAVLLPQAYEAFRAAEAVAGEIGNKRAIAYALRALGALYQFEHRYDEAIGLTRKACFHAREAGVSEIVFRCEWQMAQLYEATGQIDDTISAYWRAIDVFQEIRQDLAPGFANQGGESFADIDTLGRETAIFFDLANLLFRRAHASNRSDQQRWLGNVRRVIEILRSAELDDYFRDECGIRARGRSIESFSAETAVLYIVPFQERVELLLGFSNHGNSIFEQRTTQITKVKLNETAKEFRHLLEKGTTDEYLTPARQLYEWLIAPIKSELESHSIKTLVIVADGALRTVPFAALHDGDQFLVKRYATAVTPGLTLMESDSIRQSGDSVLVGALSVARPGLAGLAHVKEEIDSVRGAYRRPIVLANETFNHANLTKQLTQGRYRIVHLASHGKFEADARSSFIQTYDAPLTLNDLERCVRPKKLHGEPVELLVLSACQTAVDSDSAALGLAGVAVKSGARSALATLWYVNDEASSRLISEFYGQVQNRSKVLSKAEALQAAQLRLIEMGWRDPRHWSPYLIIGNWL